MMTAQAVVSLLAERWPKTFSVYESRRRPLKLKIHNDILASPLSAITPDELNRALSYYCGNPGYLRNTLTGGWRLDLDGNPAGSVTRAEESNAKQRLAAIEKRKADRAEEKRKDARSANIGPRQRGRPR